MLKKLLILTGVVFFLSCGGGSSKEAKELLQKILTIIGIPPSVITNICQTSNQTDICEGITLNKSSNKKTKPWQKISQTEIGQYLLETNIPCEPILLELKDGEVVDDDGEFFLKFSGVELGVKEKELSILEAMVDASYLTSSSVSAIKSLHNVETQNSFYATLYQDLKTNINTLSTRGLTKTQAIRGTLKEMAEELSSYGVESSLPAKLNSCNGDKACVESELTELSSKLVIYASETDTIVEAQKDNDSPLKVREVSCEENNTKVIESTPTPIPIKGEEVTWVKPSQSNCENSEGIYNDNECKATAGNAERICESIGDELPTIEILRKVVTNCGGVLDDYENNRKNKSYQACYEEKGFISGEYWSSSHRASYTPHIYFFSFDMGGSEGFGPWTGKRRVNCVRGGE